MKKQGTTTKLNGLLALVVFAVFAACTLLVLLCGAQVYETQTGQSLTGDTRRTAAQYLATRLRQGDLSGGVGVEPFGEGDALVLTETIDGAVYHTRVYCWQGHLRELFTPADHLPHPGDGEVVTPVERLTFALEGAALTARLTVEGQTRELVWMVRSGEGEQP